MGLLSAFANRGSENDAESFVSDESTTEEFTEEETLSSTTSTGTDEGSNESNPPPKKVIITILCIVNSKLNKIVF